MSGGWQGSTRSERLPADWDTVKKPEALRRNPKRTCHWCGLDGGDELDHIIPGDDHRQENLDWIHGWRAKRAGVSPRNCHGEKTRQEAVAARRWHRRGPEIHPALK